MIKTDQGAKDRAESVIRLIDDYETCTNVLDGFASDDLKSLNDLFLTALCRIQAAYTRKNPAKREKKKVERVKKKTLKDFLSEEPVTESENDKIWS